MSMASASSDSFLECSRRFVMFGGPPLAGASAWRPKITCAEPGRLTPSMPLASHLEGIQEPTILHHLGVDVKQLGHAHGCGLAHVGILQQVAYTLDRDWFEPYPATMNETNKGQGSWPYSRRMPAASSVNFASQTVYLPHYPRHQADASTATGST